MMCTNDPHVGRSVLGGPPDLGGPVSGRRGDRLPAYLGPVSEGLAPDKGRLRQAGISVLVIQTIQAARTDCNTACHCEVVGIPALERG